MYDDGDGNKIFIESDISASYGELVNMFYNLSVGAGYSSKTVDEYLDCEYNGFAISNINDGCEYE